MRHYSPYIDSFLFQGLKDNSDLDLSKVVLLDFGGSFSDLKGKVKYYSDLSEKADYLEAINNVYDSLRWAELKEDAKMVLITNFLKLDYTGKE